MLRLHSRFSSLLRLASLLSLVALASLTGCVSKVDVDATTTTGSNVEYAYVTIGGIWVNQKSGALATDSGWVGKELSTPITIDLTTLNNGTVASLLNGATLTQGTYQTLRLALVDNSAVLTTSATSLSLSNNNAIQYLDAAGTLNSVPLELADPTGDLVLPISIKVAGAASGTTLTNAVSGGGAKTSTTVIQTNLVLDVNALRGMKVFDFSGQAGVLFNPKLSAYNVDNVGTITGSLDLSAIAYAQRTSAQGVVVTAEAPSADVSRFIEVKSVALSDTGSFTLYPLPVTDTSDSNATPTYYDIVIHGNGVQPVVIASVPVTAGDTTSVQTTAITLAVASTFPVNTSVTGGSVPASTQASFYQTLPDNSLPRLIEFASLSPYAGTFSEDVVLPVGSIIYGAYNAGDGIAFTTIAPTEGSGSYQLTAHAPLHAESELGNKISSGNSGSALAITLPAMSPDLGAVATNVSGSVTLNTVGYFNNGFALITNGGQLVDVVSLKDALATSTATHVNFAFANVAGGISPAVYSVSVRLWNSTNPASTLTRVGGAVVDLRSGDAVTSVSITAP